MPRNDEAAKKALEKTLNRIKGIQGHLDVAPRRQRLQGKVAIVTGTNSLTGIGRATARLFAHEGVKHLYCSDYADDNLSELKSWLNKLYPDVKVDVIKADAASEADVESLVAKAVKDEGRLDIFFANAGIAPMHMLDSSDENDTMEVLRTTSDKASSGGSIILTASVAGLRANAGFMDYSASKAAVVSLAQTGSWELSGTDVRVNAVCPGLIETGMTELIFDMAKAKGTQGKIGQLNPLKRYGVAEEIANAVLFLASDEASYVNGIALPVCGGLSASHPVAGGR